MVNTFPRLEGFTMDDTRDIEVMSAACYIERCIEVNGVINPCYIESDDKSEVSAAFYIEVKVSVLHRNESCVACCIQTCVKQVMCDARYIEVSAAYYKEASGGCDIEVKGVGVLHRKVNKECYINCYIDRVKCAKQVSGSCDKVCCRLYRKVSEVSRACDIEEWCALYRKESVSCPRGINVMVRVTTNASFIEVSDACSIEVKVSAACYIEVWFVVDRTTDLRTSKLTPPASYSTSNRTALTSGIYRLQHGKILSEIASSFDVARKKKPSMQTRPTFINFLKEGGSAPYNNRSTNSGTLALASD
ncbi:hypothetical protein DPMN_016310 [Dreissena polymorpha]|uniref:Uncharacterized protein n=1 Tax=Dreissena polymorpha TaxID=45954 RepID=A0A9D4ND92_DREPO|nr:hypothetical protein DPMN_016310 [Dreissena polymorpha]